MTRQHLLILRKLGVNEAKRLPLNVDGAELEGALPYEGTPSSPDANMMAASE